MPTASTEKPQTQETRNPDGTFKKGFSGNPGGMKEGTVSFTKRAKEILTEEPALFEKITREYLGDKRMRELLWKMIDGNPKSQTDITTDGEKLNPLIIIKDGSTSV